MSVTGDLNVHLLRLTEEDYQAAVEALAWHLHYGVMPSIEKGGSGVLFRSNEDVVCFCETYQLEPRALRRVLADMADEKLLTVEGQAYRITERAVDGYERALAPWRHRD
ncbi:MAG: hypothetical protein IJR14_09770 [Synergistaceae bacterium]|nr:hypothetical protein [Synergistaceae bacterium]